MTDPTGSFDDLPADERVARLRRLAERALERYNLPSPALDLITDDWNCVFRVDASDGSRHVLRVSLPGRRTFDEVRGEMTWLAAIEAEGGIAVPAPLRARDGTLAVTAQAEGVPEPRTVAVFEWIEGERLANAMTERNLETYGEVAARLHAQAKDFVSPAGMKTWDSPYPFSSPRCSSMRNIERRWGRVDEPFERAKRASLEAIARLVGGEPSRMIHADLHEDNAFVLVDGSIALLDFDDCMLGWPVQDLGITVFELAARDDFESLEAALRRGYERVSAWPERVAGEVRVFAADRCLMRANYIVQDDPGYLVPASRNVAGWADEIERLLG
ncbi:MAG: phosphotransferase enzyme family protein [Actinomycetota bacterium]